jgi:hypothetical protein
MNRPLEIQTIDGSTLKFGVKFDKWAPELARLRRRRKDRTARLSSPSAWLSG